MTALAGYGRLAAVFVGVLACRIEADLVPCGELLCPAKMQCSPVGCVMPEQLTACAGAADGAACVVDGFSDGICLAEICRDRLCGDGVLVPGETCDDGNQRAGDGCSADCLSDETCGNGILDGISQEECDNSLFGLSGDGCTSTCKIELPSWQDVSQSTPISMFRLVYDSARGRAVGIDVYFEAMWEFDGAVWRRIVPAAMPERRYGFALAYDAARARVVMFGGDINNVDVDETWTWDGIVWTRETPSTSPPAREEASMVFDAARGEVVLFGGFGAAKLRDTWIWDGTTWFERVDATPPNFSNSSVTGQDRGIEMAYDEGTAQVVMWTDTGRTWLWDGTSWAQRPLGVDPSPRREPILTTLPGGGVLMFGGWDPSTFANVNETWRWDAGTWTQLSPATSPPWAFASALDSSRGRVVAIQNQFTWEWTGTTWEQLTLPRLPSVRSPVGAYLATTGRIVMLNNTRTWEWDGLVWEERVIPGPSSRSTTTPIGAGDSVLLFSGGAAADTWEYDGTSWTQRTPATSPPRRRSPGLAYDRARDRVVMFGGIDATTLADTWEWTGDDWLELQPVTQPAPRFGAVMAYDEVRGRTIMVGGRASNGAAFEETWEWDGTNWTDRTPAVMPSAQGARMTWDPNRGAVVLGVDRGSSRPSEVWEWDGSAWQFVPVLSSLPNDRGYGFGVFVYDAAHGELYAYGDSQGGTAGYALRYERLSDPGDLCIDVDTDGDGLAGCADPDCWGRCAPGCPVAAGPCDASAPHCGDGTCSPLEDPRLCPADC